MSSPGYKLFGKRLLSCSLLKYHLYLDGWLNMLIFFFPRISSKGLELAVTCHLRKFWKHLTFCKWRLYASLSSISPSTVLLQNATHRDLRGRRVSSRRAVKGWPVGVALLTTVKGPWTVASLSNPRGAVKANMVLCPAPRWKAIYSWDCK